MNVGTKSLSFARALRHMLREHRHTEGLKKIYRRFAEFTMIPETVYIENLRLAETIGDIPGSVVECGVWRGGMSAGLACVLGNHRNYYLFDSFQGLPPAKPIDGHAAIAWQQDTKAETYYDNCTAEPKYAEQAMNLAAVTSYELRPGWFEQSLPGFTSAEPIALLRLDADWYESTMTCLDHLYSRVAPGGLVVLDDYYTWDGCSRALHDFLSREKSADRIRNVGNICYLRKAARSSPT